MSFVIDVTTAHKKQLAVIIKEIANFISMSTNDTITLGLQLKFNEPKEKTK